MRKKSITITLMFWCCIITVIAQQRTDSIKIQELKEVVVQAQMQRTSSTSSTYTPTSKQKNAAQNLVDLLQQLAISQINVSLVDQKVTTLTGQNVALFINYLPASSEEIEGLQTADVRRVEYLDFPTDPRFGGSEHVVNVIIHKYEYGGYTKTSASENFMVGLSSRASVYSKFAYKRMTYDLYAGASNHNIHHSGMSTIGDYTLIGGNGTQEIVRRSEVFDNAHFRYNQYPISLRVIYDTDKTQIANTVGFNFDQSPLAETSGTLSLSSSKDTDCTYTKKEPYTTRLLTWSGNYYFILPKKFQLGISPRATYSHTDYTYTYESTMSGSDFIENSSKENYYQFGVTASLYKIITDRQNIYLRAYGGSTNNDVSYFGSSPYDNKFSDTYYGATLGYNFSNNRWNVNADAAIQWERNSINSESVTEVYPLINLSASFSPTNKQSVWAYFHLGANYPSASEKTPNVLQLNELMYQTGNSNLKLSRQITFNLQYNWMPCNAFSASAFAQYFREYKLYVPVFIHYQDGKTILKTYESDGNYDRTQIGLSFNYKLLRGKLQLAAQPSVSMFHLTGYYDVSKYPFSISGSATYYLKDFYFQASYQTPSRTIQGNRGVYYRDRDFYQILAGWSKSGWNIRLTAINMFRSDWLASKQVLSSPLYSEVKYQGGTYYHRRLNLSITYTFNYGKNVRQGNEVGQQNGGISAILK